MDDEDKKERKRVLGADLPDGKSFRFCGKKVHLTYPGHIDKQQLYDFVNGRRPVLFYSIVWETGEEKAYDHTHAYFGFHDECDTRNPRYFDFDGAHPNWRRVVTKLHQNNIWDYHHKQGDPMTNMEGPEGMPVYKLIENCNTWRDVLKLPQARNMSQVKSIWNQVLKDRMDKLWMEDHKQNITNQMKWIIQQAQSGYKNRRLIYVTGPVGCGKTTLAQYMVATMNGLYIASEHANGVAKASISLETKAIILDLGYDFQPSNTANFCKYIEDLCNGSAAMTNYECATVRHRAAVVVFSNMSFQAWCSLGAGTRNRFYGDNNEYVHELEASFEDQNNNYQAPPGYFPPHQIEQIVID